MKRKINFDVSVSGMPAIVVSIEYESNLPEDLRFGGYVMEEAIKALEKELGHSDFEVVYWDWIL